MKTLYIISGTMGVGKTTTSKILKDQLNKSVLLEGDDCWDYENNKNNNQAKKEVIKTIINKLNEYINSPLYENVIFCWVMHLQSIIDSILEYIDLSNCKLVNISLICNEEQLKKRLLLDINNGIRDQGIIIRSMQKMPFYEQLKTIKIDTTNKSPNAVVNEIMNIKRRCL